MATYAIAGVRIRLEIACPIQESESFSFYRLSEDGEDADVLLTAEPVDRIVESNDPLLHETSELHIRRESGSLSRYFFDFCATTPYAALQRETRGRLRLRYLAEKQRYFTCSSHVFRRLGLEQVLLENDAFMLHSSYVETPGGALLFTGPSGIGKSTQAALWETHAGARLVNGDRTGLRCDGGKVCAYGLPYAGSSHCFRNVTLPVRAIVRLEQAPENIVIRLSPINAFRLLYEQTTVNTWDEDMVSHAADLVGSVCERVPIYRYACTKDAQAVATLREALSADGISLF